MKKLILALALFLPTLSMASELKRQPSDHGGYSLSIKSGTIEINTGSKTLTFKKMAPMPIEGGVSVDAVKVYQTADEKKKPITVVIRHDKCFSSGEPPESEHAFTWVAIAQGKTYEGCCDEK